MKYILNTDGGARGNPGPAGIGFVISDGTTVVKKGCAYIGETTNNQAEYEALIRALVELETVVSEATRADVLVEVRMDSELVVKQLRKEYKVKDKGLKEQFAKVGVHIAQFPHIVFIHVPREKNAEADELANEAMDMHEA
ncbi:MAG: ribonuclease HI family protein [Patescibacteria group bacterium]